MKPDYPPRKYRFVVDSMLGRMAKWLRILGWDTVYLPLKNQDEIRSFVASGRIIITRALRWCHMDGVVCIKANSIGDQLKELFSILGLKYDPEDFLARCARCNLELKECPREQVHGKVPEYVWHTIDEFFICPGCSKIYWSGSHVFRMNDHLRNWLGINRT
ncbi:MAG: Mut7-C RNAse domain-containing protein [Syntrophobacterales bacterium]|nr:Mut7-C RNAse domain-containing protein [Syntrophobacterales bacterium]